MPTPRRETTLWIVALLCAALPASASGAVTIGETFAPDTGLSCSGGTLLQSSSPQAGYAASTSGVITAWSHQAGADVGPVKFKVGRPAGGNDFRIVGESQPEAPVAGQLNTFTDVRIAVEPGDVIGFFVGDQALSCGRDVPAPSGFAYHFLSEDVLPGPVRDWGPPSSLQLDLAATIEPDADADGFGDETQDGCPTDASTHGPCPDTEAPNTKITKRAPNKTDRTKLKFKFTSPEPGARFECRLDRKRFKPCSSPKQVRSLDAGKHKFQVRAVDAAGNVDPSPAKDKFEVVG